MIPKIIHYCWFGGNPLPDEVKNYIQTWKKFCPDYQIIEWNESNFNINENIYCKEAYEAKKWAFVTDYVRINVLCNYGGVYLDTDVEVCKCLDPLLKRNAFFGFESKERIQTGVIGCIAGCEWIKLILASYKKRHFLMKDGSYDLTPNVDIITNLTQSKYQIPLKNSKLIFGNNYLLLPFEYLCAKSWKTRVVQKTNKTYTIHHFDGSWLSAKDKRLAILKEKYLEKYSKFLPTKIAIKISSRHAKIVNHFLKRKDMKTW